MKKKAFLQALVIVVLLTASWFLFLNRQGEKEELAPAPETSAPEPEAVVDFSPEEAEAVEESTEPATAATAEVSGTEIINLAAAPPQWKDWMNYLQQQNTTAERRAALMALRDAIFSMDKDDGSSRLIELILSGVDLRTGLAFQVGEGGNLAGAPSLQVFLVDWLGQLDPGRSAGLARLALNGGGTGLGPDLYVLHLRNFARGTPDEGERSSFLAGHFTTLLGHQPWIDEPTSSIAESMDIAVYLGDPRFIPAIAGLNTEDQAPRLRHASSLALERMIDQDPLVAIKQLLSSPGGKAMAPETRAGFVARLDPSGDESKALLDAYLSSEGTSTGEAELFLAHFPNFNQSFSHNLVSTNKSNTESGGHMERLQRALEAVRSWQDDPGLAGLDEPLADAERRLAGQLSGNTAP